MGTSIGFVFGIVFACSAVFFRSRVMRRNHFPTKKADNVVQQLEPLTVLKRAKREPNVLWVSVGFGS
jgi:hypothetical protein